MQTVSRFQSDIGYWQTQNRFLLRILVGKQSWALSSFSVIVKRQQLYQYLTVTVKRVFATSFRGKYSLHQIYVVSGLSE